MSARPALSGREAHSSPAQTSRFSRRGDSDLAVAATRLALFPLALWPRCMLNPVLPGSSASHRDGGTYAWPCACCFVVIGSCLAGERSGRLSRSAVANGGTISGTVAVTGDIPSCRRNQCSSSSSSAAAQCPTNGWWWSGRNPRQCGRRPRRRDGGKAGAARPPGGVGQHQVTFVPHVRSASVGQTLEIHNGDPFLQSARVAGTRTLFNVGILPGQPGHAGAAGRRGARAHQLQRPPYLDACLCVHRRRSVPRVTGADGRFVIDQVPPGPTRFGSGTSFSQASIDRWRWRGARARPSTSRCGGSAGAAR